MHLHNMKAQEEELKKLQSVVSEAMEKANYNLNALEIELLTKDILDTISSLGGDFSKENVKEVADNYIDHHFYERFKEAHRLELGIPPLFKY